MPDQFRGRKLDFACAFAFWALLFVSLVTFAGIRAKTLMEEMADIDEVKEATAPKAGGFRVPMLDICELGITGKASLLDVLGVDVSVRFRDPMDPKAAKQKDLLRDQELTYTKGSIDASAKLKECKLKDCRMIGYSCHRFDTGAVIPEGAEQVDGEFTIRVNSLKARLRTAINNGIKNGIKNATKDSMWALVVQRLKEDTGRSAALLPKRIYKKKRTELAMINGFFLRLSLAQEMNHPIAFEHEMMRHVGVPYKSGVRILDVLARPYNYTWIDTLGIGYGAPYNDTCLLEVSQFTRFEPIPSRDPRVMVKFVMGTTSVQLVQHINKLKTNIMDFMKDCASMTIMFTVMAVLFRPASQEVVQKRFYFNIWGLGMLRVPEDEEESKPLLAKETPGHSVDGPSSADEREGVKQAARHGESKVAGSVAE